MLHSLSIKNYVLIDSLETEFPAGLVIITGQTGAGKSIILGALSLVLGGKADASVVGVNGENCVVEAEFSVSDEDGSLSALLDENGIDFIPDNLTGEGRLVIRRVLGKSGRTRSFINDCPSSVKLLSTISSRLIDIHSQHETLLLKDKAFQMEMLDRFAGNAALLSATGEAWSALAKARNDLSAARAELSSQIEGRDYNLAQFRQLDQAHLIDGELEELESRQKMLANAVEIKTSFNQIEALFGASGDDRPSLDSALKDSSKLLDKLVTYVPSAAELSSRIESARLELADVLDEIVDKESSVDVSGEALEEVEQRLSLIYDLLKKHSCHDVSELIALRNSLSGSVNGVEELEERCKELEKALEQAEMAYEKAASELSNARSAALDGFSSEICNSIRSLELERSVFDVVIEDATPGPKGKDNILFRFSSSGSNPVDVARCASGGEISRIMLCMKALMARYAKMPAMIFDEIDTGVSGSVADKMGSMICSMGNDMQVFAITHLPQVAAKGNAHYIVRKDYSDNSDNAEATTSISRITGDDRVNEIARILSGAQITPEAIANAKSLLANN